MPCEAKKINVLLICLLLPRYVCTFVSYEYLTICLSQIFDQTTESDLVISHKKLVIFVFSLAGLSC